MARAAPFQSRDRCNIVDHPPNQLQGSPLPSPAEHRRLSLLPPSRCVSTWVPPSSSEQASQRLSRRPTTPSTSSRRPTTPSTSSQRCRTRSRRSSRRMRSRGVAMGATWATSPSVGTGMFCSVLLTCPFPPFDTLLPPPPLFPSHANRGFPGTTSPRRSGETTSAPSSACGSSRRSTPSSRRPRTTLTTLWPCT